ncbi:prephenate dehydrogenase [Ascidiimonas aurantiaca]|uniref:prephenate dehydrogenase n=1 Tax=Ascidiimonas aurantiaca TaxID=1685432 RepID=UPI0030ED2713
MNVVVIGLGLIGGSLALDIKKAYPDTHVLGIDINNAHIDQALQLGIIDKQAAFADLYKAQLVVVATPVNTIVEMLPTVLDHINDETVVFDVGSTKSLICNSVAQHARRRNFIAAHPISGTEFSGPGAAVNGLFNGKTNIICEVEKTAFKLQEKALKLFNDLGMRIRYMNAAAHDKHIAYVSHLSHISSFMLGKTVIEKEKNERDIFDMAGSGFESTVRLAKSSPAMWTPIFDQNKENILETLDEYINNLKKFKSYMEAGDFKSVYKEMEDTNYIREILNGITLQKPEKS